jgi:hypothetical protein
MRPTVILHFDALGVLQWASTEGVEVVCVDERVEHDRVYRSENHVSRSVIDKVVSGQCRDLADATLLDYRQE